MQEGDDLTTEEVDAAFRKMAKGKATRPDDIPAQVWMALDDDNGVGLLRLLQCWWRSLQVPSDRRKFYLCLRKVVRPCLKTTGLHRY